MTNDDVNLASVKYYAVQWRYRGDWVTYSRDHATKKDLLRELDEVKNNKALEERGCTLTWRAVEIKTTTRRIDGGDR